MERLVKHILIGLAVIMAALVVSCIGEWRGDFYNYRTPSLRLHQLAMLKNGIAYSQIDLSYTAESSSQYISIKSKDTKWAFTNNPDWITITPSSGSNDSQVMISVKENTKPLDRVGVVTFKSMDSDWNFIRKITVSQAKAMAYARPLETNVNLLGMACSQTITVESNVDDWTVTPWQSLSGWCTVEKYEQWISITVTANTGSNSRSGQMEIKTSDSNVILTVTQRPAYITSTTNDIRFGVSGGMEQITVSSEAPWTAQTSYSWLEVSPESGGIGSTNVKVMATANSTMSSRSGFVYLSMSDFRKIEIPVYQDGISLSVDNDCFDAPAVGMEQNLTVLSNAAWKFVGDIPEWIHTDTLSGTGNCIVKIRVSANNEVNERNATLFITPVAVDNRIPITIRQEGFTFDADSTALVFTDKYGSTHFTVNTNSSWTVASAYDWITLSPESGIGNATVTVSVTENTADTARIGSIIVGMEDRTETIKVYQAGKYMYVSSKLLDFSSKGGQTSMSLKTNSRWTAQGSDSWIGLSSTEGTEDCDITITAADNPSTESRSGYVDIIPQGGNPVRINVSQAARYLSLSADTIEVFSKGGVSTPITVTTDGTYNVVSQNDWLSVTKESDSWFTITATEYHGDGDERIGSVTVLLTDLTFGTLSKELVIVQKSKESVDSLNSVIIMERSYYIKSNDHPNYVYQAASITLDNDLYIDILYHNAYYWDNSYSNKHQGIFISVVKKEGEERYRDEWYIAPLIKDEWVKEKIIISDNGYIQYYINDNDMGTRHFDYLDLNSTSSLLLTFNPYGWWTVHYHYMDNFKITTPLITISDNFDGGSLDTTIWMTPVNPDGVRVEDNILKMEQLRTDQDFKLHSKSIPIKENSDTPQTPKVMPEYVDLGLSVMWATFNVGATKPEEYGDYFAWGETDPKNKYDYNYKYYSDFLALTKYCNQSDYGYNGYTDSKTVLDLEDDAAHVNWGDGWRMPNNEEQEELCNNCTWSWTTLNGVNGYLVTSNKYGYEDRSIFLPAAGSCYAESIDGFGTKGYYWSSSLSESNPNFASNLYFGSGYHHYGGGYRYYGQSVRPVFKLEIDISIELTQNEVRMTVGDEPIQLTATTKNSNGDIVSANVQWSTSNGSVATVSETGLVTATGVGTCTITASVGDVKNTCVITVSKGQVTPEYVDLGLSVMWATFNVGATKPEEYGDYFAWGETEPKSNYSWDNYKWSNGSETTLTKYCNKSEYGYNGYTDSKTVLDPEDDAAHVNWGGNWRMPTVNEYDELLENCTWTWTTQNSVGGYLLTSNIPGYENRSIFLPAAGFYRDDSISYQGSIGNYWSSMLRVSEPYQAQGLVFFSSFNLTFGDRVTGCPVRPVCP